MIISVTKTDIKKGLPGRQCVCPIALAIMRKSKQTFVNVHSEQVRFQGNFIDLPKPAVEFISNFDADLKVRPFKFKLDIPLTSK